MASRPDVPRPHTWGEVAIIQARILAGSWTPSRGIDVCIVHGRHLLGEASLIRGLGSGHDVYDVPQTIVTREPDGTSGQISNTNAQDIERVYQKGLEICRGRLAG